MCARFLDFDLDWMASPALHRRACGAGGEDLQSLQVLLSRPLICCLLTWHVHICWLLRLAFAAVGQEPPAHQEHSVLLMSTLCNPKCQP